MIVKVADLTRFCKVVGCSAGRVMLDVRRCIRCLCMHVCTHVYLFLFVCVMFFTMWSISKSAQSFEHYIVLQVPHNT